MYGGVVIEEEVDGCGECWEHFLELSFSGVFRYEGFIGGLFERVDCGGVSVDVVVDDFVIGGAVGGVFGAVDAFCE